MGVVVGASLAVAGAEMQTILNNPLASPFTLGVLRRGRLRRGAGYRARYFGRAGAGTLSDRRQRVRLGDEAARALGLNVEQVDCAGRHRAGRDHHLARQCPVLPRPDPFATPKLLGMRLSVEHLSCAYGRHQVLHDLTLTRIDSGALTALVGPNAVGKSTFFRCLAGLQRASGHVLTDDARVVSPTELRRLVCYLPQDQTSTAVLTVFEAVLLARQQRPTWVVAETDLQRVAAALFELGIEDLALRHLNE